MRPRLRRYLVRRKFQPEPSQHLPTIDSQSPGNRWVKHCLSWLCSRCCGAHMSANTTTGTRCRCSGRQPMLPCWMAKSKRCETLVLRDGIPARWGTRLATAITIFLVSMFPILLRERPANRRLTLLFSPTGQRPRIGPRSLPPGVKRQLFTIHRTQIMFGADDPPSAAGGPSITYYPEGMSGPGKVIDSAAGPLKLAFCLLVPGIILILSSRSERRDFNHRLPC
jgi:hypothetical protein